MLAAELTPGGVDSACHPSEVGYMSTSVSVYWVCSGFQKELATVANPGLE